MKTKYLILTLIALAATVFSCQRPEKDLSLPSIEINKNSASVDMPSSTFTMMVLTNRAWRATADVPWIAIDPDSGKGDAFGQTVTVTVMENTSFTRSGHITFDNVYDSATMTVDQAGKGNPEDFILYFNNFDKEVATQSYGSGGTAWPFLDQFEGWKNQTGVGIADVTYDFASISARANSQSNSSYSDYAGSGANNLLFAANGFITVKNINLKDFRNLRLSFGSEKYDNNNKEALFDPAEMLVYLSADGAKGVLLPYNYLGTAAGRWNVAEATFSIPADVTSLGVCVQCKFNGSAYRLDDLKIEVAEEAGALVDFSNAVDLPSSGGSGGGGGSDTPSGELGSGTLADPYTPLGAANAVKNLTWTSNTVYDKTEEVYVKGKISRIANNGTFAQSGTYGNASFWISADGSETNEFQCFRILYIGKTIYTSGRDIAVGDEVIVCGKLMNYKGNTPETVANDAYLHSFVDGGSGGGGGSTSGFGSGTLADPYTALGAANAVKNLTWTSNTEYQKTDEVYVKGKISRIASKGTFGESGTYGNASFWISADGAEKDEFQCYRIKYLENSVYTSGRDIVVGDEVIICGKLMNYKGNTPETVANEAYLHSFAAAEVGGGGGGDTPSGGDTPAGTITWAVGSGNQTWAAATHATYGKGFSATKDGMTVAYYKSTSTSDPVDAKTDHIRVYKASHLSISVSGKKITSVELTCLAQNGNPYCENLKVSDGSTAVADKTAGKITWSGEIAAFEADSSDGQIRISQIKVTCK